MMRAYDEMYLDDAMENLAEAFDYVANAMNEDVDEFADMLVATGIGAAFGLGSPKYISGLSGVELAMEIYIRSRKEMEFPEPLTSYDRSPEYWCGWVLAYYQWYTGRSFRDILQYISMDDILRMYPTLHEASEDKFVGTVNKIIEKTNSPTKLQSLRRVVGYSQKLLAEKSGVSLRMIQQYEQRAKDINKATGANLIALARTLGCNVEDLMEFGVNNIESEE